MGEATRSRRAKKEVAEPRRKGGQGATSQQEAGA